MIYFALIATLTVHVLSGVFWAGSTSAMANLGVAEAARLFPSQMGSATLTVLTGLAIWFFQLGSRFHTHEQILLVGIAAAIIAAAVQGKLIGRARRALAAGTPGDKTVIVARMTKANRIAAGLLMVTVACMIIARFY